MRHTYCSSLPHQSISPRPHTDASLRYRTYGPIQSMHRDTFDRAGRLAVRAGIGTGLGLLIWMASSVIPRFDVIQMAMGFGQ